MERTLVCLCVIASAAAITPDKPQENCFDTTTSQMYSGKINTSLGGAPCHAWTSNHFYRQNITDDSFPDGSILAANNYCRDPMGDGYLWCPLREGGNVQSVGWETCNIPRCMSTNCSLLKARFRNEQKVTIADNIAFYNVG